MDWIYSIGTLEEKMENGIVKILKLICLNITEMKDNFIYWKGLYVPCKTDTLYLTMSYILSEWSHFKDKQCIIIRQVQRFFNMNVKTPVFPHCPQLQCLVLEKFE